MVCQASRGRISYLEKNCLSSGLKAGEAAGYAAAEGFRQKPLVSLRSVGTLSRGGLGLQFRTSEPGEVRFQGPVPLTL